MIPQECSMWGKKSKPINFIMALGAVMLLHTTKIIQHASLQLFVFLVW